MKIKILTGLAGADFSFAPGDTPEFSDKEAKRLIKAGIAEEFTPDETEDSLKKLTGENAKLLEELAVMKARAEAAEASLALLQTELAEAKTSAETNNSALAACDTDREDLRKKVADLTEALAKSGGA